MLHGHHVVRGRDLDRVFGQEKELEDPILFRHRLIHGITLTVLAGIVAASVVLAVLFSRGDLTWGTAAATKAAVTCPSDTYTYGTTSDIHIRVYNATRREGLAASVADGLRQRGFVVDAVENKTTDYTGTAVIVAGEAGRGAAFTLQRNIPNTDFVADGRNDAVVDVVLTSGFADLVPPEVLDTASGQLSCPRLSRQPSPTPSG
jgi:hypothetical protein